MPRYLNRYGHYREARKVASKHLEADKLAALTDDEVVEFLEGKYVFLKNQDEQDNNHEEEVILIPKNTYDNIKGIEFLYR